MSALYDAERQQSEKLKNKVLGKIYKLMDKQLQQLRGSRVLAIAQTFLWKNNVSIAFFRPNLGAAPSP